MAENTVDEIVLEIEASSDKADASLQELASALTRIKNAVKDIQTSKLTALKTALNGLTVSEKVVQPLESVSNSLSKLARSVREVSLDKTVSELRQIESLTGAGENIESLSTDIKQLNDATKKQQNVNSGALKNIVESINGIDVDPSTGEAVKAVGVGFKSVASSVNSMKDIEPEKLNQIADTVSKVGAALGDLGSNNKINIKISADGIQKTVEPVKSITEDIAKLQESLNQTAASQGEVSKSSDRASMALDKEAGQIQKTLDRIRELKAFLASVKQGKIIADDDSIRNAENELKRLNDEYKNFISLTSKPAKMAGMGNMSKMIDDIIRQQNKYKDTVSNMDSGKTGFNWEEYRKATEELEKLNNATRVYQSLAKLGTPVGIAMLGDVCKRASAELYKLANAGLKVLKGLTLPFVGMGNIVKKEVNSVVNSIKGMNKAVQSQLNKMAAFWKRSMKTFTFMMVRKAITAVIGDIKTAIDSLALWSKNMGTPFNDSVSSIVADFKYMARSILTIVEPLINAVAPLLAKLADMFSNLAAKIASLMAALTGQSYYMKAKKNIKDYSSDLDKASKKAKGALQSFDELNNITTQSGSQDSPVSGWKDEWEKLPVDEKAKELADKLKKILSDLWYPIGEAWDRMKDYVLGGWKYMTGELKKLFKDVWDDFIEVWHQEETIKIFENIFGMIGDIEFAIGHLARNFRAAWNEADTGKHILENIRDIVGILVQHARNVTLYFRDWAAGLSFKPLLKSIEVLTNSLKRLADFIGGVFEDVMIMGVLKFIKWFTETGLPKINLAISHVLDTFDFDKIRKDIQPVIVAVEKLMEHLVGGVTKAGENLGVKIAEWFNSDKFTKFTQAIAKFLDLFTEDRIAAVLEGIGTAFLDIASALADILSSKAVLTLFEGIGKVIDALGAKGISNVIKAFAGLIVVVTAEASKLALVGTVLAGLAKIKFAWDVATVAKGLKDIGGTADGLKKAKDGVDALKGAQTITKGAQTLGAGGTGGAITPETIAGGESTMLATGLKIGGWIVVGIATAIDGYFAGNWLGKFISKKTNPDDLDLYKKYEIGGEGNLFKDLLGVGNKNESPVDNIKDMFNGIVEMATDFKNNPVIAWLTSGTIMASGFGGLALGAVWGKKLLDGIDTDQIGQQINGVIETIVGKFDEFKTKASEAFDTVKTKASDIGASIKEKFEPITSTIEHIQVLIGGALYASLLTIQAAFKMVGDTMDGVFTKVAGIIDEKVIQPLEKIFETVDTKVVQPTVSKFEEMWSKVQEIFGYIMPFLEETVIIPLVGKIDESVTNIIEKFNSVWEKIQEIGGYVMPFLEDTIILPVVGVIDTAVTGIKDDFTLLWEDVKKGAKTAFGAISGFIEKMMNGLITGLNVVVGALNKLGGGAADYLDKPWTDIEPFQKITIPKFEHGGFPEDGIFAANHNELVGQFSNGKTAVANNGQIIDGISNGVQQANAQQNVLFNQMIDLLGVIADKDLTIGDDAVFSSYQRGASRYGKRYGVGI